MIKYMNENQERVIITIEDPIENIFTSNKCIIKQRELGSDTNSYHDALRHTLRQDPDVICVGEILDAECFKAAIRAAETGNLVISTVHSPEAVLAFERIVSLFPPEQAHTVTLQLSTNLIAILYQELLPKKKWRAGCRDRTYN